MAAAFRWALVLMFSMLLIGCGGNSSSSAASASGDSESPAARHFEGRAVKGVVRHGVVEAHEYMGGAWQLVSTAFTDESGYFDLDLTATTGPVRVTILANNETVIVCDATPDCGNVALGGELQPSADFRLITLIPSNRTGGQVAITPLTHLAARWIELLPEGAPLTDALIEMAFNRVADMFGVANDFAWRLPIDITDEDERTGATSMLHELLGASFSSIAYQYDVNLQDVLEAYAAEFSDLAGQLFVHSDLENLLPGLDLIHELTLASINLLIDETQRDALIASVDNLIARWGENPVTDAGGAYVFNQAEFDSAMVLLEDLNYYLDLAGINDSASFLSTQMAQLQWLYNTPSAQADTSGLILIMLEGVMLGVVGSMSELLLAQLDEETRNALILENCIDMSMIESLAGLNLESGYAEFCLAQSKLTLAGARHGQVVDVVMDVSPLSLAAPTEFTLRGSNSDYASVISNTSVGQLGGTLTIIVEGLNGGLMDIEALRIAVAVQGSGSLAPDAGSDGFEVSLEAAGAFDFSALLMAINEQENDAPVLMLQVNNGHLVSPFGDWLMAMTDPVFCQGRLPLQVELGAQSSLQACFGFEAFNLPEMHMTLGGTLSGLFDFIGQVFSGLGEFDGSFSGLINGLDPSVLTLLGDARLKVLDHENGERVYVFGLNNNRLDSTLEGSDHALSFYATSLNGGYIFSGSTLVATVHSDWQHLGARLRFTDGRADRSYLLGSASDVIDEDLIQLLITTLLGVMQTVGGIQL